MDNKAILSIVLSIALAAPIASANATQTGAGPSPDLMYSISYVQSNLKKGRTTRADVIASFGNPSFQRVRASDSGASETLYYKRGSEGSSASGGGGVAKATRGLGNIAGGLSRMMGYNKAGYQAASMSNQANNVASGMEAMGLSDSQASQPAGANGPTQIVIEIVNGVVSSYSME